MIIEDLVMQDTLKPKPIIRKDTLIQLSNSSVLKNRIKTDSSSHAKAVHFQPVVKFLNTDTAPTCRRNCIADITFYDSTNIVTQIDPHLIQNFPFVFIAINRKILEETKTDLVKQLRNGDELPTDLFHYDWVLPVMLLSIFIYGVIRAESVKFFKGILTFISFRGINESISRDFGSLFQWPSTLLNLASFINISLFVFFTFLWYNILPYEGSRLIYWVISLGIIIAALTIRHFVCIILGNLSDEKEVFREYLVVIYQAYRLTGIILLVINTLLLYTTFIPVNILFYAGFSLVALLYFIRAFRLFLIFITRHVSIFYLILYLCALEILPVMIIVKYATGLI